MKTKTNIANFQIVIDLLRYGVVGGAAFAIDFFLLFMLTEWVHIPYLYSATISFGAGFLLNYILSVYWVFTYRKCTNKQIEFFIFLAVGVGGIIITDLILTILTPLFDGNYLAVKIIAVIAVFFWNFFLRRQLLFTDTSNRLPVIKVCPSQGIFSEK